MALTVEVVPRQNKPPRKVHSITEAGRQMLQAWADQPVTSSASLKTFVMRLILAGNFSQAGLIAHLQQRHAQIAAHHAALEQTGGTLVEGADLGQRLALDYALDLAAAELAWLESTLKQLAQ